jgi:hypothetical protein
MFSRIAVLEARERRVRELIEAVYRGEACQGTTPVSELCTSLENILDGG